MRHKGQHLLRFAKQTISITAARNHSAPGYLMIYAEGGGAEGLFEFFVFNDLQDREKYGAESICGKINGLGDVALTIQGVSKKASF